MSIIEELWYGNINPSENKEISDEEKKLVDLNVKASGLFKFKT